VATRKGYEVLRAVREEFPDLALHVSTFRETNVEKSYHEDILQYAEQNGIDAHTWKTIRSGGANWVRSLGVKALVCVGWRYLVPDDIAGAVDGNVVVAHDSLLPKYRGFAPLPSALINGEPEVGVTYLFAADEVDAGDILYQDRIQVTADDRIADLIERVVPLYTNGAVEVLRALLLGVVDRTPQDHSQATFSIWRDEQDLLIDWTQPASRIERSVRALGPPYLGARTRLGNATVTLRQVSVTDDVDFEIRQPGKVWALTPRGEPQVVCGTGLLTIEEADVDGRPLVPMDRLRIRFT